MKYWMYCKYKRFRDAKDGIGVVEVILILVGICTHEYGMYMECIS